MRVAVAFCALLVVLAVEAKKVRSPNPELDESWTLFKSVHNKSYSSKKEEVERRLIFEDNVAVISKHNREVDLGMHSFNLGINKFADMSNKEFRARFNGYRGKSQAAQTMTSSVDVKDLPATVDWRNQGYVTPVKNQGQCGSCWAFSTTGSLEGAHFKKTKQLVSLSEQNLVDCSTAEGNQGCNGGLMDQAFAYIKKNGGIDTESAYPYTGEDGKCSFKSNSVGATLTSWVDVKSGDEAGLQEAVATVGPIAVAIDASSIFFQFYFGGVYDLPWCSSTELDHGVLAVGYGTSSSGKAYWLVKNSWGDSWGEYGYIRMSRNKNNQCGIATNASYPIV